VSARAAGFGSAGAGSGLAYRIAESGYRLNIPRMFAALLLLSVAVSLPLRWSASGLGRARWAFETALGSASVVLGVSIVLRLWQAAP